jgi:hypothetical protein
MRHKLRSHLTYANVMVTILAFIVLGGGTALAAIVVSSNSQVASDTISGHNPPSGDRGNIIAGSINGHDIQNASIGSVKLNAAAQGARAYGRISPNSNSLTRSKNITGFTSPSPGIYCIALGGFIDASTASPVVTPDYAGDATVFDSNGSQAIAEVEAGAFDCPAGTLEVRTGHRNGTANIQDAEAFSIVVG